MEEALGSLPKGDGVFCFVGAGEAEATMQGDVPARKPHEYLEEVRRVPSLDDGSFPGT